MPKPLRYFFIVLALFGLAFAIWTGIPRRPHAAEESAAPQAAGPEITTETRTIRSYTDQPAERTETAVAPTADDPNSAHDAPSPAVAPRDIDKPVATLTARFVDALGNPWPGVLVVCDDHRNIESTSDAAGRVTLEIPQPYGDVTWSSTFVARRRGNATKTLRTTLTAGTTTQLGDVQLGPGVDVLGRAVDESGRGVRAKVGVMSGAQELADDGQTRRNGPAGLDRETAVESTEDGSFRLEGIAPGEWRLWAHHEGTRYGWSEKFTLVEGADATGLVVVVPAMLARDFISGVVLSPDGQPVPDASISYSFAAEGLSSSTSRHADKDGRFRIVVDLDDPLYDLSAGDPESRYADALLRGVKPGTHDVELRLGANAPFYIVLRGPEGEPVTECSMLIHREVREGHWSGNFSGPKSNSEGRYELVAPLSRFMVEIDAEGYAKHQTGAQEPPAAHSTLEIRLARPQYLRGRVIGAGQRIANVVVKGFKDAGDSTLEVNGFRALHGSWPDTEATTDAEGEFKLPISGEERLWVRVETAGFAACELGPLAPIGAPPVELVLVPGGSIEGVVLLPDGKDAEGTIVGLSRGDGFGRTMRAGPGGRFRFDGLTPGNWQVLRRDSEVDPDSSSMRSSSGAKPIEWSCEVSDGRTTRFDLDLSRP